MITIPSTFRRMLLFTVCAFGLLLVQLRFEIASWEIATRFPFGVINLEGKWLIPPIFQKLVYDSNTERYLGALPIAFNLSAISHSDEDPLLWWVVFDRSGKILNLFDFDQQKKVFGVSSPYEMTRRIGADPLRKFDSGFAVTANSTNHRWGVVDRNNALVIPFKYDLVTAPRNGFFVAQRKDGFDMYDLKGKVIDHFDVTGYCTEPILKQLFVETAVTPDWYKCLENGGKTLREYDCVQLTNELTLVQTHGPDVDEELSNPCIVVQKHRCGIVNKSGRFVLPMRYRALLQADDNKFIAAQYD